MTTGTELRDSGTQLSLAAAGEWERSVIEQCIASIGRLRGEVSAADVRDLLPVLASTPAIGGVFLSMARRGLLVDTGRMVRVQHPTGRCRRVVVWRFVAGGAS